MSFIRPRRRCAVRRNQIGRFHLAVMKRSRFGASPKREERLSSQTGNVCMYMCWRGSTIIYASDYYVYVGVGELIPFLRKHSISWYFFLSRIEFTNYSSDRFHLINQRYFFMF